MTQQRENWGSKIGFLLATAGSAIGLGSLWKFPFSMGQNGGGLFLILYLLFTFLIALPIFMGELVIGRRTQKSPIEAFLELSQQSLSWKLLGFSSALVSFFILSYYSVVAGWGLNYMLMSLNHFTQGRSPEQISGIFDLMLKSADINIFYLFIFLLMTVGVVWSGIKHGIEHYSRLLIPALFIVLLGLATYSATLPGFKQAWHFMFHPDLSKLTSRGILEALGLAFYSVSIGMGIIITYGSYMSREQDIPKLSLILAISGAVVSVIAGLMIFPIVFTFGFAPSEGPGLVFKTMPLLFERLPMTVILSTSFFLLVVLTALTSAISIFEVIVATAIDTFSLSRKQAALYLGIAVFLFGIPSAVAGSGGLFHNWSELYGRDFFTTIDYLCMNWLVPLNVLFTSLFLGWYFDAEMRKKEFMRGSKMQYLYWPWIGLTRWIVPVAVTLILLQEAGLFELQ